jgi:hypothetical protein
MPAPSSPSDVAVNHGSRAWAMRAERARRIATMVSRRDAQAIEAYAQECEAMAERTIERQAVPTLAASLAA